MTNCLTSLRLLLSWLLTLLLLLMVLQHRIRRSHIDHRNTTRLVSLSRLLLKHKLLQDVASGLATRCSRSRLNELTGGWIGLAHKLAGSGLLGLLVRLLDELLLQLLNLLLGLCALLVLLLLLKSVLLVQLLKSSLLLEQNLLVLLLLLRLLLLGSLDLLLQLQLLLLIGGQHRLNVQHRRRRNLASGVHQNHFSPGRHNLLHLLLLLLLLLLILLLSELNLGAGQVRLNLDRSGGSHRLLLGAYFASLGEQILLRLHRLRRRGWTDVRGRSLGQQLRSLGLFWRQMAANSLLLKCSLGGQLGLCGGRRLLGSYICLLLSLLLLLGDLILLRLLVLLSLLLLLLLLLSLLLGLLLCRLLGLLGDAGQR